MVRATLAKRYLLLALVVSLALIFLSGNTPDSISLPVNDYYQSVMTEYERHRASRLQTHLHDIFQLIRTNSPTLDGKPIVLSEYKDNVKARKKAFDDKLPIYTNKELGEFLIVTDEERKALKKAHQGFVAGMPAAPPVRLFSGKGIVTVAGGKYIPSLMVTLKMIRRIHCDLPMEVFMVNDSEYEPDLCQHVLPSLNARCVFLADLYGQDVLDDFNIKGYEYKAMSLLASAFEDVVFIDADSVPVGDLEAALSSEPYKSTGLVTWPDYWYRTVSPHYYDIAGVTLGPRVRGNLSETDPDKIPQADLENAIPDKTTESGQMFISKRLHYRSLVLALYYNVFGYEIYYPLLSQGSGGEGDKETFRAAAIILNEHPSYQVFTDVYPYGFTADNDEGFKGSSMPQANPVQDYEQFVLGTKSKERAASALFVHVNTFKINPRELFKSDLRNYFLKDDTRTRLFGNPMTNDGRRPLPVDDLELEMWKQLKWFTCDVVLEQQVVIKDWLPVADEIPYYCGNITRHVEWLQSTTRSVPKKLEEY